MEELNQPQPVADKPETVVHTPKESSLRRTLIALLLLGTIVSISVTGYLLMKNTNQTIPEQKKVAFDSNASAITPSEKDEVATSPAGEVLFTSLHKVFKMDPSSGKVVVVVEDEELLYDARWSPDHKKVAYVIYCDGCDYEIEVLDLQTKEKNRLPIERPAGTTALHDFRYGWKDSQTLRYSVKGSVVEYNTVTKKVIKSKEEYDTNAYISSDGTLKVYGKEDGKVYLEDTKTKEVIHLDAQLSFGFRVIFSPDSERMAVFTGAGESNGVELFDKNGKKLAAFPSEEMEYIVPGLNGVSLAFSPDNKNIFILSYAHTEVDREGKLISEYSGRYYAFMTDISGQNPKQVAMDFFGERNTKKEFIPIVSLSW